MSKADYEVHIVVIGRRRGRRYAERKPLNVPLDLALGQYERLSDLQVRECLNDMIAEDVRRQAARAPRPKYDPLASQITRKEGS